MGGGEAEPKEALWAAGRQPGRGPGGKWGRGAGGQCLGQGQGGERCLGAWAQKGSDIVPPGSIWEACFRLLTRMSTFL